MTGFVIMSQFNILTFTRKNILQRIIVDVQARCFGKFSPKTVSSHDSQNYISVSLI